MIVKLKYVFGTVQVFRRDDYTIAPIKETNPAILKVEVFTDEGKKLYKRERHFKWFYERFMYKPAPEQNVNVENVNESVATEKPAEKTM